MTWHDTEKEKYRALTVRIIGLVAGAMLFSPSILGIIQPPFYYDCLFFFFWGASATALVLLGIVWWITHTKASNPPARTHGLGNLSALFGLIAFAFYIGLNAISDPRSLPSIDSITAAPNWPEHGAQVQLTANVSDQDHDEIGFSWKFDDKVFGDMQVAYWPVPLDGERHSIELTIQDDSSVPVSALFDIHVKPKQPDSAHAACLAALLGEHNHEQSNDAKTDTTD